MTSQVQKFPQHNDRNLQLLAANNAMTNLPTKDMTRAKRFYGETLGFRQIEDNGEVVSYQSGDSTLLIYKSEFAGTNKATAATWDVGEDIDAIVRALKSKGVTFESYDMPGTKREGDLYVGHGMKVAWFKDPNGNILNIYSAD